MEKQHFDLAEIIWNWLPLSDLPRASDMIFVFGSDTPEVPLHALQLYRDGLARVIVVSGGFGRLSGANQKPEADIFASVLIANGVPEQSVIVENRSANSGENISFSKRRLEELGLAFSTGIAVTTPLLSRRQKATLQMQWPEISWQVSTYAPPTAATRLRSDDPAEFLNLIVGEIDRLEAYPGRGYMTPVDIPAEVLEARTLLADAGYTRHAL